jgi:hypothetical protein
MGDLSLLTGSKYLKRLNQTVERQSFLDAGLPINTWVEVLSLTGKHWIDMAAVRCSNSATCHAKYEIDGATSSERQITGQNLKPLIGLAGTNYTDANIDMDAPSYAKSSFKLFVKRTGATSYGIGIDVRLSQVVVDSME